MLVVVCINKCMMEYEHDQIENRTSHDLVMFIIIVCLLIPYVEKTGPSIPIAVLIECGVANKI